MTPHYADTSVQVFHGDCLDVLRELPNCSVDSVVTDPPYGLEFMGKEWDNPGKIALQSDMDALRFGSDKSGPPVPRFGARDSSRPGRMRQLQDERRAFGDWCELWAAECLRVLKPGGHLLAFGGTRTWHRLTCAIEDAGFEIRDSIAWMYGSGFPKSLDVSKAIDRAAGAEREVTAQRRSPFTITGDTTYTRAGQGAQGFRPAVGDPSVFERNTDSDGYKIIKETAPATEAAQQWQGWGTALKPAHEPIVVARKPLSGTVAATVLQHGTGALNIDATRIAGDEDGSRNRPPSRLGSASTYAQDEWTRTAVVTRQDTTGKGRWPANVILDESQADALDQMSGESGGTTARSTTRERNKGWCNSSPGEGVEALDNYGDQGGASRYFKVVPLDSLDSRFTYTAKAGSDERITHEGTSHPTVKPLSLMRWLVRLVTPPGGVVLEPFAGSGTTVEAAILEGFRCIAIEREADYLPLITQRIHRRRDPIAYLTEGGHDLGLFGDEELEPLRVMPEPVVGNGRDGEPSAERRYTDKGGTNFAPKPGRRRTA